MTARGNSMKGVMFVAVSLVSLCGSARAEKSRTIPLDQIWAYKMPGARDVRKLEPQPPGTGELSKEDFFRRFRIQQILTTLSYRHGPKDGETAGPAFVVIGTGKEALKNASAVFTDKVERAKVFPADAELSLVFYSYSCGRYVRITSVKQVGQQITVKYQFVSHATAEMTKHFALIPIGKLAEGVVQVKIQQVTPADESGRESTPMNDPLGIVSNSFSFEVRR